MNAVDLMRRFGFEAPKNVTRARVIQGQARDLALSIKGYTQAGREQDLALARLEEAVMWAYQAVGDE